MCRCLPRAPLKEFNTTLHERLNSNLLASHLIDFAMHGFGFAAFHFARAALGFVHLTFELEKFRGRATKAREATGSKLFSVFRFKPSIQQVGVCPHFAMPCEQNGDWTYGYPAES